MSTGYREITAPAVVLGVLTGAVMTAAFVYIGLKLGFGLSGSTVAAIVLNPLDETYFSRRPFGSFPANINSPDPI